MYILLVAPEEQRNRHRYLEEPLRQGGHKVEVVKVSPVKVYISRTFKVLQENPKPDLVIVVGVGLKSLAVYSIARYSAVPVLVRLGGDPVKDNLAKARSSYEQRDYKNWLTYTINMYLAKILINKFDGVMVVSTTLAEKIDKQFKGIRHLMVVPQYCEVSPQQRDYSVGDPLILLSVTNLSFKEKANGVIWLINQVNLYAKTINTCITYRIAGGGVHLSDVSSHLSRLDRAPNLKVILDGFVQDIEAMYLQADIFLYYSDHDELPNTILEAKRFGMPMIVNECKQFRAVVTDKVSGMLFKNEQEFLLQLSEFVSDKHKRKTHGMAAKKELAEKNSFSTIQKLLEHELEKYVAAAR